MWGTTGTFYEQWFGGGWEFSKKNKFAYFTDRFFFLLCLMYYNTETMWDKFIYPKSISVNNIEPWKTAWKHLRPVELGLLNFWGIFGPFKNFLCLMCAKQFVFCCLITKCLMDSKINFDLHNIFFRRYRAPGTPWTENRQCERVGLEMCLMCATKAQYFCLT